MEEVLVDASAHSLEVLDSTGLVDGPLVPLTVRLDVSDTGEAWGDALKKLVYAHGARPFLFLLSATLIFNFWLFNLFVAIFTNAFQNLKDKVEEEREARYILL